MGALVVCVAILYALSHIPLGKAAHGLSPVLVILVFTVVVRLFPFTVQGLLSGLFVALRIALLVLACSLLTFTTSSVELTNALVALLSPLRRLGAPVDDLALVITLALRFIPQTADEAYAVRKAQMSRGADFDGGSVFARVKAWGGVLSPLIVRLFLRAEDVSRALDARCYGNGGNARAYASRMSGRCRVCVAVALICFVAFCWFF